MTQQPFPPPALRGAVDLSALKRPAAPARGAGPGGAGTPSASGGAADAATPTGGTAGLFVTGTDATFQEFVNASLRYPVVVVLWSSRLPESGDFAKVMGGLAASNQGRFQVVSVDVDENPGLLRALQVQQVPVTMALLQGRPLPLFVGPLLPQEVQPVIDELLQVAVQNGITGRVSAGPDDAPSADEEVGEESEPELPPHLAAAFDAIEAGDLEGAATAYEQALAANPADLEAKAGLAQVGLLRRTEGVDPVAARAAASADPTDVASQILVADLDLLGSHVEEAFTRLVDTVRATSGDDRNAAREHLLELFEVVGPGDDRVAAGRRALMSALF
jgi:putative thioredoxin